ncbi:MAG TPA: histidinol-phosphatase [Dongiaceae bacterium]|jgi:histidinol phosphatase-like enzyme (inositol monophosphatase family)|nr:histidinol-phosphatase [Dongiaceae bacterium]
MERWRALAEHLADCAQPILKKYFRQKLEVLAKADDSPVTIADREAESAMRAILGQEVPTHGIVGEEHGAERENAEYVWVLDPIDGTKSFITGRPLFGTLVALLHRGNPILGIIDMPILGDRWLGMEGAPTTLNGTRVEPRPCGDLSLASLAASSPHMFSVADHGKFERLRARARLTTYNGDCYMYGMVATGFLDIVVEKGLATYDFLALAPILHGAGACLSDWQGRPISRESAGDIVASGDRRVHDQALEVLRP